MNDLKMTEQTISSLEVADMVEKQHKNLLRDITKYNEELNQLKIEPVEFFRASTYRDGKGEIRPCFDITKKRLRVHCSQVNRNQRHRVYSKIHQPIPRYGRYDSVWNHSERKF